MGFENLVVMVGEISKIGEMNWTRKGTPVVNFKLTVKEKVGIKTIDTQIECMAFGKDADFVSQIPIEGYEYYVKGKLRAGERGLKLMIDSVQQLRVAS